MGAGPEDEVAKEAAKDQANGHTGYVDPDNQGGGEPNQSIDPGANEPQQSLPSDGGPTISTPGVEYGPTTSPPVPPYTPPSEPGLVSEGLGPLGIVVGGVESVIEG